MRNPSSRRAFLALPVDNWTDGDLPGDQIAVPAIAEDAARARQTFLMRIVKKE
jgi:hypothetical protein